MRYERGIVDEIDITIGADFPPDGSFPPRIVMPQRTFWLHPHQQAIALLPFLFAEHSEHGCEIYQTDDRKEVKVNGLKLMARSTLRDGDFIHVGQFRAIFQQDPVADFRNEWQLEGTTSRQTVLAISKQLEKHVRIGSDGISFDSGRSNAHWNELSAIDFSWEHTSNLWRVRALVQTTDGGQAPLPSKFRAATLGGKEANAVLMWLLNTAPFHPSFQQFSREPLPDAYWAVAEQKIVTPANEKKRVLPMPIAYVMKFESRKHVVGRLAAIIVMSALASLVIGLILAQAFHGPVTSIPIILGLLLLLQYREFVRAFHHFRELPKYEKLD